MTASNVLADQVKSLRADADALFKDDTRTLAEKQAGLEKLTTALADAEAKHKVSESYAALMAKTADIKGEKGETLDGRDGVSAGFKSMAQELLASGNYKDAVAHLGGADGSAQKSQFRKQFEIGRVTAKDASAGANLMGDAILGASGPSALGNNPFYTGAAGPSIMPNFLPGIVEQKFFPLTIADLFTSVATESPVISYLVEATMSNNADLVAEGGLYPYSSESLSRQYVAVGKIANAIKVTDETVRDAPQFYSFVNGRLVLGVQRREESALLAGPGGTSVNGLLNLSASFTKPQTITAVTNVNFPPTGATGQGMLPSQVASLTYGRKIVGTGTTGTAPTAQQIADGIFQAMTDIWLGAWVVPDAIVMNPADWFTLRTGKDSQGQYFGGSFFGHTYGQGNVQGGYVPGIGAGETLWGKRVVVTPVLPVGTILVGSFGPETANIFRRQGISVEMTNSNGTDFEKGEITVRAEERLALAVYRPAGFELIQLAPAP